MSTRLQQWQAQAAKSARPSTVFDTDDGSPKENEELNNVTFLADRSTNFAILNARYIAQLTQKVTFSSFYSRPSALCLTTNYQILVTQLSNGPHLESAGTEHRELRTLAYVFSLYLFQPFSLTRSPSGLTVHSLPPRRRSSTARESRKMTECLIGRGRPSVERWATCSTRLRRSAGHGD